MVVMVFTEYDEEEGTAELEIKINGGRAFRVRDGETEDNNLSRNFSDCYKIADIIQQAYNAGKNGEDLTIETVEG